MWIQFCPYICKTLLVSLGTLFAALEIKLPPLAFQKKLINPYLVHPMPLQKKTITFFSNKCCILRADLCHWAAPFILQRSMQCSAMTMANSLMLFFEYHHLTAAKQQSCSEQDPVLGNIVMATKQMGHPTPAHSHCSTVCDRNHSTNGNASLSFCKTEPSFLPNLLWARDLLEKQWACVPAQGHAHAQVHDLRG